MSKLPDKLPDGSWGNINWGHYAKPTKKDWKKPFDEPNKKGFEKRTKWKKKQRMIAPGYLSLPCA